MLQGFDVLDWAPLVALLLPLCGFIVLALFGDAIKRDREEKGATILACALVVIAFLCAVAIAVKLPAGAREAREQLETQRVELAKKGVRLPETEPRHEVGPPVRYLSGGKFNIIEVGGLRVPLRFLLDPLSAIMLLVVTGIGSLIHIYSLGYMAHDPERVRYFSYLNLFTFFMLLLVLADSLPLMFVGWEGVGLCSYLLIGFWFKKKSASDAGKKAFVVNRIGDAGLILGMALAFHALGTLDMVPLAANAGSLPFEKVGEIGVVTGVALLLFIGACGKSAQIPLHIWLPDAMEGPTPVSALIHAATMVTAGVYMVARLGPLFARSGTALLVMAVLGTATALVAATIALVQTDIKKVLAYSTVSQLGYMFLACGMGAFSVAVFHLFTHAFFKALLFLGSGSVIHALSGEQDLRKMGGLSKKIPWTFWTFVVGTAAIAGLPPLAGFFSKDAILAAAYEHDQTLLFLVALATAILTAFYMTRLVCLAFLGSFRGSPEIHPHESPPSMLIPLVLLAAGSAGVGFISVPAILAPPGAHLEAHHPAWLPWLASLSAILGIVGAVYCYRVYTDIPRKVGDGLALLRRLFEAKWGFDDAGNGIVARLVVTSRDLLWGRIDAGLIDGAVNGTASVAASLAETARAAQPGFVRAYALLIAGGTVIVLGYLLWLP